MVNALALPAQKPGDRALWVGGFQQFYLTVARLKKRGADTFAGHFFDLIMVLAQKLPKAFIGRLQIVYGYADVLNFFQMIDDFCPYRCLSP